jgi:hypothetical protein
MNLVKYGVINFCRIWSPTGLSTSCPLPAEHCLYLLYYDKGKGEESRTREKVRGATVRKAGSKIPIDCLNFLLSPLINTCRKIPLQVNFVDDVALMSMLLISPWNVI